MQQNKPQHAHNHNALGITTKDENGAPVQVVQSSYQGPIPPASELIRYESIEPGFASRILALTEKQSEHRQEIENTVINSNIRDARLGLYFGFTIGMTAIICGTLLAILGREIAGSFIGGGGLIGLVSVFVLGSRGQIKERLEKEKIREKKKKELMSGNKK